MQDPRHDPTPRLTHRGWKARKYLLFRSREKNVLDFSSYRSGVESRTGAVALASRWLVGGFRFAASIRFGVTLFPVPAHRTGLADFPHPALGKDTRCFV